MDIPDELCNQVIKLSISRPGSQFVELKKDTKVRFHFQTRVKSTNKLIDDSRTLKWPMELIIGHEFKLPVWEAVIRRMSLNQIASFTVDKSYVMQYPFVMKQIRDMILKPKARSHCCQTLLMKEGTGYRDLDELANNPQELEFTFELIQVELPDEYTKEPWMLTEEERRNLIEPLKEEGNKFYKEKNYEMAIEKYKYSLTYIEKLLLLEKPHDKEWNLMMDKKCQVLLNFCQCKFQMKEYYEVITCCNQILQHQPNNVKAFYRRGCAHAAVWNSREAEYDFKMALRLDSSLKSLVDKQLAELRRF